jgi:hypothetical protein
MNGSVSASQSKLCFSGFWAQVVNLGYAGNPAWEVITQPEAIADGRNRASTASTPSHTTFGNFFAKEALPRLRERNPEPTKVALAAE